ncbi:MAG: VanZ family protein [Bacteroidota bacterium]
MPNKIRYLFYIYIAFLLLIAILPINGTSSPINDIFIVQLRLDYLLHGLVFIPWMGLSGWTFREKASGTRTILFLSLLFIGILYACCCELIQMPLTYRTFNINDLLANVSGVVLGAPGFWLGGRTNRSW